MRQCEIGSVHVHSAQLSTRRLFAARTVYSVGLALLIFIFGSKTLQNAVAEGDTRTITMHHLHTGEDITITVVDIDRGKIRLGIEAPREVPIFRQELLPLGVAPTLDEPSALLVH